MAGGVPLPIKFLAICQGSVQSPQVSEDFRFALTHKLHPFDLLLAPLITDHY
jgi:hypothetical protein